MGKWSKVSVNRWLEKYPPFIRLADAEWLNTKHKHEWECVFGHKTKRTFDSIQAAIRGSKSPCNKCHVRYHGEETLRFAIETITLELFPKVRPKWLTDPVTGNPLELDGYSDALKLAFEFDGKQHDEHVPHFQPGIADFQNQQRKDKVKESLCEEAGVTLIRVKQDEQILRNSDVLIAKVEAVRPEVVKNTIIDWTTFEPNNRFDLLEKAKSHAEKYGGVCNSKVILSPNDRVQFYCPKHDHNWEPRYNVAIKRDQWCKECGYEARAEKQSTSITHDRINNICEAAEPQIEYLAWAGEDEKGRNLWKCTNPSCEFPFKMSALNLVSKIEKKENPCPSCNKKRRTSIWELHRIAELKGGLCVTFSNAEKFGFKCHNQEHPQFELTKSQAKEGVWCDLCPDRKKQKLPIELVEETAKQHGYKLIGEYHNNHSSLALECLICSRQRNDINFRQLKRATDTGSAAVSCDFCRTLF